MSHGPRSAYCCYTPQAKATAAALSIPQNSGLLGPKGYSPQWQEDEQGSDTALIALQALGPLSLPWLDLPYFLS